MLSAPAAMSLRMPASHSSALPETQFEEEPAKGRRRSRGRSRRRRGEGAEAGGEAAPEKAAESEAPQEGPEKPPLMGSADGLGIFRSLLSAMAVR